MMEEMERILRWISGVLIVVNLEVAVIEADCTMDVSAQSPKGLIYLLLCSVLNVN